MESDIKVKATTDQMDFFESHFCVKYWERDKFLHDKKGRCLWKVRLRHGEEHGKLKGTYTVEYLMEKFRNEACHTDLKREIRSVIDKCVQELSFFGEIGSLPCIINEVLSRHEKLGIKSVAFNYNGAVLM